jgi:Fe-S-cluster-containing dehydrogenase component
MIFDMPTCGACRTCEIACSFHHTGEFRPSVSSIKILDKANGQGHSVQLYEEDNNDSFVCDGCAGFQEPFCVQQCGERERLANIIAEFLAKRQLRRKAL